MIRVSSLLGRVKRYLVVGIVFSLIYSPCDACSKNMMDESQVIEYVIVMDDDSRHEKIGDFLYKKAREYARQNKEFSDSISLESKYDKKKDSFDIIQLDENEYLIHLTLNNYEIRESVCLFLINPARPNWTPLLLEVGAQGESRKSYSFISHSMKYSGPLLSTLRWSRRYDGENFFNMYVFKEGVFKLILSEETTIDEKKAEGINLAAETTDIEEHLKTTVHYIAHDITQLYAKFAPKEDGGLEKSDNWEKIFFVKPSKTYFYEQPNEKTKQASYITRGDAVYIRETKEAWALANYLDPKSTQVTTGWVKKDDLENLWEPWTDHVCAR
jgi:hypothetical protein